MTGPAVAARSTRGELLGAMAVVVVGCGALLGRPWMTSPGSDPLVPLTVLFVALGVVGATWPVPEGGIGRRSNGAAVPVVVGLAGAAAFMVGRLLAGSPGRPSALVVALGLNGLAAVAEEAFFRRFLYGVLERRGTAVAVVGSALAFAAVHVTVWGWWVLPLDLAAGLILSWQRWASGRWSVPAATHVFANVLALL